MRFWMGNVLLFANKQRQTFFVQKRWVDQGSNQYMWIIINQIIKGLYEFLQRKLRTNSFWALYIIYSSIIKVTSRRFNIKITYLYNFYQNKQGNEHEQEQYPHYSAEHKWQKVKRLNRNIKELEGRKTKDKSLI